MSDGVLAVKSDVWQVADGFDWTLSIAEWGERASGHSNDAIGAYRAMDRVITALAAKHREEIDDEHVHEKIPNILAIRTHADARPGFTN